VRTRKQDATTHTNPTKRTRTRPETSEASCRGGLLRAYRRVVPRSLKALAETTEARAWACWAVRAGRGEDGGASGLLACGDLWWWLTWEQRCCEVYNVCG
jgi:hypothetical protein